MSDKSDRRDGDGLSAEFAKAFPGVAVKCNHVEIANWFATRRGTPPTHDGAEGAADWRRCHECGEDVAVGDDSCTSVHCGLKSAPPKPAPDAMREALVRQIAQAMSDGKDSGGYETLLDMYAHTAVTVIEQNALSAPVPPADGAREQQIRKNYADSAIFACIALADEVVCAKGTAQDVATSLRERFSPSPAVAAEPVADERVKQLAARLIGYMQARPDYSYDLLLEHISETLATFAYSEILNHRKGMDASPPVRGDRETDELLAEQIHRVAGCHVKSERTQKLIAWYRAKLPVQSVVPRLPQDTLDRLAMLNVSEEEVYEVLTKHLPEDMIDGIWQEIKEAGRSGAGERK